MCRSCSAVMCVKAGLNIGTLLGDGSFCMFFHRCVSKWLHPDSYGEETFPSFSSPFCCIQGHFCDWRGLMCILPELDFILGALPQGPYVRFYTLPLSPLLSPPPFSLSYKQKQNYLFWSSSCLLHCGEIMCGSVSLSDCAACVFLGIAGM